MYIKEESASGFRNRPDIRYQEETYEQNPKSALSAVVITNFVEK